MFEHNLKAIWSLICLEVILLLFLSVEQTEDKV